MQPSEHDVVREALSILEAQASTTGDALTSTSMTRDLCRLWLGASEREEFGVLFLDTRHRLIAREVLFRGTVDRATVYPREILKRGLALNCAAVILCHNHPSGCSQPSTADISLTRSLSSLLLQVDIRVLDHFVVAATESTSMAERGLLS